MQLTPSIPLSASLSAPLSEKLSQSTQALQGRSKKEIATASEDFAQVFLSEMFKPMFSGSSSEGFFGKGYAQGVYRDFFIDALAKEVAKSGHFSISKMVQNHLYQLQEIKK